MTAPIEIICIGNELLIGKTVNTNAQWLAKRITTLGLSVKRIAVVGDDVNEISTAVTESIQRKPRFIITTGGLGPTFDDKTLEGIAKALNRALEINQQALKMVEKKYQEFVEEGRIENVELTPPRIKMATLPIDATPLPNSVGTAPGVQIKFDNVKIVSLPGVPSEMKSIFEESIEPLIKLEAGQVTFYEIGLTVDGIIESDVAPLIDRTLHLNPHVYIKSHPSHTVEGKPHLELHLSTTAQNSTTAKNRISKALMQITELIQTEGGNTKPTK